MNKNGNAKRSPIEPGDLKEVRREYERVMLRLLPSLVSPNGHFDLNEAAEKLRSEVKDDPYAKAVAIDQLCRDVVSNMDRKRRPKVDPDETDLFQNQHAWIPLGGGERVLFPYATVIDFNIWRGIVDEQIQRQFTAHSKVAIFIRETVDSLLRSGKMNVASVWQETGWSPTADAVFTQDDDVLAGID